MDVSPAPADEERFAPPDVTFRRLAEAMPQLVWSARPDGQRDYFNERWHAFTGMPRSGEGEGDPEADWRDYLHRDDAERVASAWERARERGESYEVELRLKQAATGAYRWFLERAAPLRDETGEITRWFGTDTDVDDAKRGEAAAAVLARAGELLGSSLALEPALAAAARAAVPALADWCAVDLADPRPDGSLGVRRVAVEHRDPAKVALARQLAERYPDDPDAPQGVHHVLRTGRVDFVREIPKEMIEASARDAEHLATIRALGLCSYIVAPILEAGAQVVVPEGVSVPQPPRAPGVLGAITFVSAESARRYTERDVETARELARQASLAVERARLYEAALQDRERLAEQAEELSTQNEQLHEQAAELEMQATQLQEQATELEMAHEQLQQQAAELEASQEQLQEQAAELEVSNEQLQETADELAHRAAERDAAHRQLATVLEQSPTGIVIAEAPSGRMLFVNRRTHEIFGRSRLSESVQAYGADWAGRHADGPDAGREVAPHEWPIARAVERGETVTDKIVEIARPGAGRALISINAAPVRDDAGRVVAGVAVFDDVTAERHAAVERERLIQQLSVERARFAELFRQAPAFIAVLRGPEHVFEMANDEYYKLVGRRDVVGKPVREALPEVVDQGFVELLDQVRQTGEPYVGTETPVRLQRTPGAPPELCYVTFVYQPLHDVEGSGRARIFVHGVDVTPQVRARAEVEQARAEAEAARERAEEANRAKSEFLASMSHELRTPLNAIGGYAELMELGVRGPVTDQQREDLARIRRSQRHLLTLINDILHFTRIEGGRVEYDLRVVRLSGLVADVAPMIEPQVNAQGLTLDVRLPTGPGAEVAVRADAEKVRQILLNLLSNAVKFTSAGGRVRVEIATEPARPDVVLVRVSDTGIGVPADKLEAIFDAFVQVHAGLTRRHEGTGLGLAISRDLARGMGGDLTVESEVGKGSTFTLALPRA